LTSLARTIMATRHFEIWKTVISHLWIDPML